MHTAGIVWSVLVRSIGVAATPNQDPDTDPHPAAPAAGARELLNRRISRIAG